MSVEVIIKVPKDKLESVPELKTGIEMLFMSNWRNSRDCHQGGFVLTANWNETSKKLDFSKITVNKKGNKSNVHVGITGDSTEIKEVVEYVKSVFGIYEAKGWKDDHKIDGYQDEYSFNKQV